ncbi:MAG TPA: signal peptidase I [Acidimicrobiales bacterium]|nr:signal peptidase I [Acidimicrobiales bacterium]
MSDPPAAPELTPGTPEVDNAAPVVTPEERARDARPPEAGMTGPDGDATGDRPAAGEPAAEEPEPVPGEDGPGTPDLAATGSTASGERSAGASVARNVVEWLTILGGALVVALVVTRFLVQAFFIPSLSMFPALDEDDRVLVNKLSYRLHDIHRGDLIVFQRPSDDGPGQVKDLIKRVVALGGERIEARDGRVLINGKPLPEPYLPAGVQTTNLEPLVVPDGHVFVMGDNRGDSRDSRFFGPLPEDLVIGRAFVKVWPLDDLELL